jgi:L,D-transpeptidase YcbB
MTRIAKAVSATHQLAVRVLGVGALIAIGAPLPAHSAPSQVAAPSVLGREIAKAAKDFRPVYAARNQQPIWFDAHGTPSPAVDALLERVETAQFDGIDGKALKRLRTKALRRDLDRAIGGDPEDIAEAELGLSTLFADYVRAVRGAYRDPMIYESNALAPVVPSARAALEAAAKAPSLDRYVREMGWMHPFYAPLRDAMNEPSYSAEQRRRLWENLGRVRALPATPADRYVLVDAVGATLWMYEHGKPVGSMKVVVGKPETPTPTMAGFIRHAIVNPYWNVPTELAQRNIATQVRKQGLKYLKANGYEVMSDFTADAKPIDPKKVDWAAVARGDERIRVRQRPGTVNFMGKVKYEFPNEQGIYLHDTPDRHLFKESARQFSNGCVRLEDAERFGKWLLGKPLPKTVPGKAAPEQRLDLPTLVPVYITYLTAMPTERGIAFRNDVYGRDTTTRMALAGE